MISTYLAPHKPHRAVTWEQEWTLVRLGVFSRYSREVNGGAKAKRSIVSTSKIVPHTVSSTKQRLEDLPPSAKLVYKTLEFEGECTQKELVNETRLPARTVRYATSQLEEEELVKQQVSFRDARQKLYSLTE